MSALEVDSSVRYCEHLLFVQRSQRHTLSMLGRQFKQLQGLCQVLSSCKNEPLAPQVAIINHNHVLHMFCAVYLFTGSMLGEAVCTRPGVVHYDAIVVHE